MYPFAPDSRPRPSSERSLYAVKISTATSGTFSAISFVACSPSIPGMRTSMITTFGRRRSASETAVAPSEASPMTRMCGARDSDSRSPSRTTSWSSTIRQVISRLLSPPLVSGCSPTARRFYVGRPAGALNRERKLLGLGRRLEPHAPPVAHAVALA